MIELVISLAIIAAVAMVALDNFTDSEMRTRQEKTLERGKVIQEAIQRFVSDMGRWPKVRDTDSGSELAELYRRDCFYHNSETETMFNHEEEVELTWNILDLSETQPAVFNYVFPTARMRVGWAGPYLNTSSEKLYDGYGRPWRIVDNWYLKTESNSLVVEQSETDSPSSGDEIQGVTSYGADGAEGSGDNYYDSDEEFLYPHENNLATLSIYLKMRDDTEALPAVYSRIMIFAPTKTDTTNSVMELGYYLFKSESDAAGDYVGLLNDGSLNDADRKTDTSTSDENDETRKYAKVDSWTGNSLLTIGRLVPGRRLIYAFAGSDKYAASAIIPVELKRGNNSITIILDEIVTE